MLNYDDEYWLPSKTLHGSHEVSNLGRIRRVPRFVNSSYSAKRKISQKISVHDPKDGGYRRINIKIEGVIKGFLVHRLVAEVFVENPNNYPFINHKDGDKKNNHPENLEWCTHQQNMKHAMDTGLSKCKKSVLCISKNMGYWFPSMEEATKFTGISKPCICAAAKKKQRTAGKMIWEYC